MDRRQLLAGAAALAGSSALQSFGPAFAQGKREILVVEEKRSIIEQRGIGTNALQCVLAGNPRVATAVVNLSRNADGTWDCNVTPAPNGWKAAYLPGGCQ